MNECANTSIANTENTACITSTTGTQLIVAVGKFKFPFT